MSVFFRQTSEGIVVSGKTFPYRSALKSLGGNFLGESKEWLLPDNIESVAGLEDICKRVGGGRAKASTPVIASPKPSAEISEEASALSVLQLVQRLKQGIEGLFPEALWIVGELQNISVRHQGHFFVLAEPKAQAEQGATVTIQGALWRNSFIRLSHRYGQQVIHELFKEGLSVKLLARVQFYKDRSSVSLEVVDVDLSFTEGQLALARIALIKELRSQGLIGLNQGLSLRPFSLRLGLISAHGSRAYSDFINQLEMKDFPGQVVFCPAAMQGEKVAAELLLAIQKLEAAEVDYIVITRGGGSAADLRWFDTREVALAICQAKVPIIAAIGHHDDHSVAEVVAFHREKTPTAAAEYCLRLVAKDLERIAQLRLEIGQWALRKLQSLSLELEEKSHRLKWELNQKLAELLSKVERDCNQILRQLEQILAKEQLKLAELREYFVQKDPRPWLAQGYTQLDGPTGKVIHAGDLRPGDELKLRLLHHRLNLKLISIVDLKEGKPPA